MGTGLIFLLPGLLGGTFASGIGTGLLRGLPGLGGGIRASGIGTGLTDLRRGGGGDGAFFLGGLTLSDLLGASLFPVFAGADERAYLRTALEAFFLGVALKGRIASIIFSIICFWRDFSSARGEAFFFGACDRLVAAARPGSRLGSLVRFRRTGVFRFGAGITSSDQLDDSVLGSMRSTGNRFILYTIDLFFSSQPHVQPQTPCLYLPGPVAQPRHHVA